MCVQNDWMTPFTVRKGTLRGMNQTPFHNESSHYLVSRL